MTWGTRWRSHSCAVMTIVPFELQSHSFVVVVFFLQCWWWSNVLALWSQCCRETVIIVLFFLLFAAHSVSGRVVLALARWAFGRRSHNLWWTNKGSHFYQPWYIGMLCAFSGLSLGCFCHWRGHASCWSSHERRLVLSKSNSLPMYLWMDLAHIGLR